MFYKQDSGFLYNTTHLSIYQAEGGGGGLGGSALPPENKIEIVVPISQIILPFKN
jgi:hypothetical protein